MRYRFHSRLPNRDMSNLGHTIRFCDGEFETDSTEIANYIRSLGVYGSDVIELTDSKKSPESEKKTVPDDVKIDVKMARDKQVATQMKTAFTAGHNEKSPEELDWEKQDRIEQEMDRIELSDTGKVYKTEYQAKRSAKLREENDGVSRQVIPAPGMESGYAILREKEK